jgi:hypothetical protein
MFEGRRWTESLGADGMSSTAQHKHPTQLVDQRGPRIQASASSAVLAGDSAPRGEARGGGPFLSPWPSEDELATLTSPKQKARQRDAGGARARGHGAGVLRDRGTLNAMY